MIGIAMANRASGGTGVGPGAKRYRFIMETSHFCAGMYFWDYDGRQGT
jgi:hypothetical protein